MLWSHLGQLAMVTALAAGDGTAAAQDGFVQNQTQLRAALENRSTSPSFVFVTVVDGRSGERRTGCTIADFLLQAIAKEDGTDRTDHDGIMLPETLARVTVKALASKDHIYIFHKPEALAAVSTENWRYDRACQIIRSGVPAYMQDRSGQILPGQPR